MEAQAARWRPRTRRWRRALEERRVLAPLLIAPAIIFMALVVGVPFVWAIYLSFTDAIGGSLSGNWVGFDNFTNAWQDENFRRALRNTLIFTLASQVLVVIGAAILSAFLVRDFRGKWFVRFLVVLPWAAPVVLSTITWLWILDSLYSVVNWTLAKIHLDNAARLAPRRHALRGGRTGAAPVARTAEPGPARDHARPRVADPPVRGRHLHRRPRFDPERGRGRRPRSTARPGSRSSGTSIFRCSFRSRSSPCSSESSSRPETSRSSTSSPREGRSTRRRCCPRGRSRSGSTPAPSARALPSRCTSSRSSSPSPSRCSSSRVGLRWPDGPDRRQKTLTYLVVGPFAIVLAFPFYLALVTMFKTNADLGDRRALAVPGQRRRGQLPLGLLERRHDRARQVPVRGHELPAVAPQHASRRRRRRRHHACSWRCRPATRSRGSPAAGDRARASASSSSISFRRRCSSCRSPGSSPTST